MVEVKIELSKLEIQMLLHCIDSVIDVKHVKNTQRLEEIKKEFEKYL